MRAITADGVAWSVGLLVTFMDHAKTAEPIEMPFGWLIGVRPGKHVLDGGRDPSTDGAVFWGLYGPF